ncbi:50S ribosomal protein L13 [symbiont of Argiope bruennichi]|uniref:50S ribosomal protein L13 n=1 Tax=symbiont of Argiope bruennichi TaxID=2810479 RepID=UPI003DA20BFD
MNQTTVTKKKDLPKKWYLIDASNLILGKLSVFAANILRGKNKANFCHYLDCGDFLVITNTDKVNLSGNKLNTKIYYHHSRYPGGLRETKASKMLQEKSDRMVYLAIKGMLPHNRLGRKQISNLFVYKGSEHKHIAQNPEAIKVL